MASFLQALLKWPLILHYALSEASRELLKNSRVKHCVSLRKSPLQATHKHTHKPQSYYHRYSNFNRREGMRASLLLFLLALSSATVDGLLQPPSCLSAARARGLAPGSHCTALSSSGDDDDDIEIEVDTSQFQRGSKAKQFSLKSRSPGTNRKSLGSGKASGSTMVHVCTNCGAESVKWMGKCGTCNSWGTLVEEEVR
jgi:hypothetical protein